MRSFKIPYGKIMPDKIIGGILTPKESIYVGSILVLFTMLFVIDTSYILNFNMVKIIVKATILLIHSGIALTFVFKKKDIYDLDYYIMLKIKHKYNRSKIPYEKY